MKKLLFCMLSFLVGLQAWAQKPDPNFHIYICFGQSNMEGNAPVVPENKENISPRFQVMGVCKSDEEHNGRKPGKWYTAVPPLCRWNTGLTPADYFGRTLCDSLPSNIRIGIVMVAVGGAGIDMYDEDSVALYYDRSADWHKAFMDNYDRHPYRALVEAARKAQKSGVVKGILFHQGETNNGQKSWLQKVHRVYDRLCNDLRLEPNTVPFLAGEMLQQDMGGCCWLHNDIIRQLPDVIPTAHVVSSKGCTGNGHDNLHFSNEGYQKLGRNYAEVMLQILRSEK